MSDELKPCPFCGNTPTEDSYYLQDGGAKWGGILCCIEGPEVRTGYEAWPAWKDAAIREWNQRPNDAVLEAAQKVADTFRECLVQEEAEFNGVPNELGAATYENTEANRALALLLPPKEGNPNVE